MNGERTRAIRISGGVTCTLAILLDQMMNIKILQRSAKFQRWKILDRLKSFEKLGRIEWPKRKIFPK